MNLRALYPTYRVALDEDDTEIIPGRHGHVYVHSSTRLGAASKRRGHVARELLRCCEILQDGDDGVNVAFEVSDFFAIADLLQLKKKRIMTEEQKAANVDRLKAFQYARKCSPEAVECVKIASVDLPYQNY